MSAPTAIFSLKSKHAHFNFLMKGGEISMLTADEAKRFLLEDKLAHFGGDIDMPDEHFTPSDFKQAVIDAYLAVVYRVNTSPSFIRIYGQEIGESLFLACFDQGMRDFHQQRFDQSLLFNARDTFIKQFEFAEYPNECHYISFETHQNAGRVLTSEALQSNAVTAIKDMALFLNQGRPLVNGKVPVVIHDAPDHRYLVLFCPKGNDISFSRNGEEVAYWVCDEFALDSLDEVASVLGAIAGSILTHD